MKGITPIIALILLLVIVIVVVGFSFGIFQGVISSAGEAAETQADETAQTIQKTVKMEAVDETDNPGVGIDDTVTVSIRSLAPSGALIDPNTEVGIYLDGSQICAAGFTGTIDAGDVATCAATIECTAGLHNITVTSPSGATETDTLTCA